MTGQGGWDVAPPPATDSELPVLPSLTTVSSASCTVPSSKDVEAASIRRQMTPPTPAFVASGAPSSIISLSSSSVTPAGQPCSSMAGPGPNVSREDSSWTKSPSRLPRNRSSNPIWSWDDWRRDGKTGAWKADTVATRKTKDIIIMIRA